ncbi:MAG: type II toxin-antitoxin system VapC family toxin [Acidimicrobiaceae bacterium]|nr:type II toxin-antitoxin system VapC family toxin [Acidimicrobiaceae bacterium]MYH43449.1 type II toxin-antitoxin system VapC family toxin [Acidimicrobiaceae bacterium]MYJ81070.1 type II toxin-antitoxin system VapC family toxin [Acidimicrobiaceae bacterium]
MDYRHRPLGRGQRCRGRGQEQRRGRGGGRPVAREGGSPALSVFVDTSVWFAAAAADDADHARAAALLERFEGRLLTSDHVIVETWMLAAGRLGASIAEALTTSIRTDVAQVEAATVADLEVAAQIRESFPDQRFSLVDRTSWAVMQRLSVHEALSLDRDYSIYRFGRDRRRAFTVHS